MSESRSSSASGGSMCLGAGDASAEPTSEKPTSDRPAATDKGRSDQPVVLVVEDDARLRDVIVAVLGMRGFKTLSASEGVAALATMRKHGRIDILLADVVMPGMNGYDLARAALDVQPDLPVLLMTGGVSDDENVLRKPFTMDLLVRTMRARLAARLGPSPESP
jgi:CheY-like chemotaxis protein